jgi:hypothetical protein
MKNILRQEFPQSLSFRIEDENGFPADLNSYDIPECMVDDVVMGRLCFRLVDAVLSFVQLKEKILSGDIRNGDAVLVEASNTIYVYSENDGSVYAIGSPNTLTIPPPERVVVDNLLDIAIRKMGDDDEENT